MDKVSLLTFLLISIPEEFMLIAITALVVGRKDILNLKNRKQILKLLIVTVVTAYSTVVLRLLQVGDEARIIIECLFFIVIYTAVLRMRWYEASVGFLVAALSYLVLEYATSVCVTEITGITVQDSYYSDVMRFLFFLPARFLQVGSAILLYKSKLILINFGEINRFTKTVIKRISIIHVGLFITLIHIFLNTKYFMIDNPIQGSVKEVFLMWFNVLYSIVLAVTLIVLTHRLSYTTDEKKRQKVVDLLWFKALVDEYKDDTVKITETICKAINENKG